MVREYLTNSKQPLFILCFLYAVSAICAEERREGIDFYLNMVNTSDITDIQQVFQFNYKQKIAFGITHNKHRDTLFSKSAITLAPRINLEYLSFISWLYWEEYELKKIEMRNLFNIPSLSLLRISVGGFRDLSLEKNSFYAGFIYGDKYPLGGWGSGIYKSDDTLEFRWQIWKMLTNIPIFIGVRKADRQFLFVGSIPASKGIALRSVLFYSNDQKALTFADFIIGTVTRAGYYNLLPFDSWYFLHDSRLVDMDCMSVVSMSPFKYLIPPNAWRMTNWGIGIQKKLDTYRGDFFKYLNNSIYAGLEVSKEDNKYKFGMFTGVVKNGVRFHLVVNGNRTKNLGIGTILRIGGN